MARYIVNYEAFGIERKDIEDKELTSGQDNTVIIVLDKNTNEHLYTYYNSVLNMLVSKNKVILLMVGTESTIRKPLCTLMCSYRNYNIYTIESASLINIEYIDAITQRNPTYEEVQTFIGGDITAYSDINTIVIGIENLVNEGNISGLKVFLEQHLSSISSFTEVVDYMKKVVDTTNSGELHARINELRTSLESIRNDVEEAKKTAKETNLENLKLKEDLGISQKDLARSLAKLEEYQNQASSKTPVIKSYTELNTSLIKCKTKLVIYFKEVSQIPYINSLVLALVESIKLRKLKVKLVIYDNKTGLSTVYKPLNVIGSTEYMSKRDIFAGKTEKIVVVEPNPIILDDVLTYSVEPYDVVVIYDRMKQLNDLVIGNNVHKFFVINSNKDFNEVKTLLKINDKSTIITRPDCLIGNEVLDIPKIEGYTDATETAKISKYMKITTAISKKPLIKSILDRVRIDAISKL